MQTAKDWVHTAFGANKWYDKKDNEKELETMIKTFTLEDAISQVFSVDGVPEFRTYKPVKEARAWLERNELDFEYQRKQLTDGIVFFAFGAGQPQITIVDGDAEKLKGAQILAVLKPTKKTRKVGTVKVDVKVDDETGETTVGELTEVEDTPIVLTEDGSHIEDKPKKKRTRKSRRSK